MYPTRTRSSNPTNPIDQRRVGTSEQHKRLTGRPHIAGSAVWKCRGEDLRCVSTASETPSLRRSSHVSDTARNVSGAMVSQVGFLTDSSHLEAGQADCRLGVSLFDWSLVCPLELGQKLAAFGDCSRASSLQTKIPCTLGDFTARQACKAKVPPRWGCKAAH